MKKNGIKSIPLTKCKNTFKTHLSPTVKLLKENVEETSKKLLSGLTVWTRPPKAQATKAKQMGSYQTQCFCMPTDGVKGQAA